MSTAVRAGSKKTPRLQRELLERVVRGAVRRALDKLRFGRHFCGRLRDSTDPKTSYSAWGGPRYHVALATTDQTRSNRRQDGNALFRNICPFRKRDDVFFEFAGAQIFEFDH